MAKVTAVKKKTGSNYFVWIVLIPVMLHFMIFEIFPVIFSFIISFFNWPIVGAPRFIGLGNWQRLLGDPLVWKSLLVTFKFSLYYILPTIVIGLLLALFINSKLPGTGIFKSVFFLPSITSVVVVAALWVWIFIGFDEGIANSALHIFGIPSQSYFGRELALFVLALLSIYRVSGTTMVYYYAGLKGISEDVYEAAKIDGANAWQKFYKITLPLLKPTTLYVLIITTIGSLQVFDSSYILTRGGPDYATSTLVYDIYKVGFFDMQFGYASSIAYILFIIILLLTVIQYKFLNDDVSYN